MKTNKKWVWLVMAVLLSSLALAQVEQAYPELIGGDAELGLDQRADLNDYLGGNAVNVLDNEEKVLMLSLESWIEELSRTPPGGYKSKLSKLNSELNGYYERFSISGSERQKIERLSSEEQAYLVSSLGRSRGQTAYIYEGTMGSPLFNYILFHENFHTYTNPMFVAQDQLDVLEARAGRAAEEDADLLQKINYLRARSRFLDLWENNVGDEKAVSFSNYGRTNKNEQLSEFFARLNTRYFAKSILEFDAVEDDFELRRYLAAFVLADCAGLLDSFDEESGQKIKKEILGVVEEDLAKKEIYDEVKAEIEAEIVCPLETAVAYTESGEAYECSWESGRTGLRVTGCRMAEVSELQWESGNDAVYVGYDYKGKPVGAGFFKANELVVTNYLDFGVAPERQYEPLAEGTMTILRKPGMRDVKFFVPDSVGNYVEQERAVNPARVARQSSLDEETAEEYDEFEDETGVSISVLGSQEISDFGNEGQCVSISGDRAISVRMPYSVSLAEAVPLIDFFIRAKATVESDKGMMSQLSKRALAGDEGARQEFLENFE